MSHVSTVLLATGNELSADDLERINDCMQRDSDPGPNGKAELREVEVGGTRVPVGHLYAGTANYLDVEELARFVCRLLALDELGDVQLFVKTENEEPEVFRDVL